MKTLEEDAARDVEALRRSERLLRATFEQAAVGMAHVGLDGTWLDVNQRLCEILGYERDELIDRMSFQDVTYPDDLPADLKQYRRLLRGEVDHYTLDKRYVRKDGSVVWVSLMVALVRDADGQPDFFIGVVQDISERKQMESQLKLSRERLRLALDAADLGTWDWDLETGSVVWGGYAVELFGPPPGSFDEAYRLIVERVHPADHEALERVAADITERDDDFSLELRLLGPADGMQWIELRGRVYHRGDGQAIRVSGIVQDVTERQRLRERHAELLRREQEARREAEEASEIKSRFLAMVSHELRTPLTSIMGFSSTLLAPDVVWDAESQHDFISTIHEEAEKLKDLVEQLLEVSRLQSGTLRMERSRITLDEALAVADAQLQMLIDRHVLEVNFPDDLPAVDADAQRIAQVFVNLVSNAVKYSPPGSHITLSACRGSDGTVRVEVSDEGPGIPPEARDLVFEAFRQIERDGSQGAGLGLAICKGLIEAHGGRIWVVDDPPPGATLAFTLLAAD